MKNIDKYFNDIDKFLWKTMNIIKKEVEKKVKVWKNSEKITIDFWDLPELEELLQKVYNDGVNEGKRLERFNIK